MVEHIDDLDDERIKKLDRQLLDIEYDIELQRDIIEKQRQEIKEYIKRKEILKKRARLRVVPK
tara:strand:+ start:716 stop:904 length:189 start_codon:yes stop_codon:yes gene_type:complete